MEQFPAIAPYLSKPLVLVGFTVFLLFGVYGALARYGRLPWPAPDAGVFRLIVLCGFVIAFAIIALGFRLEFLRVHLEAQDGSVLSELEAEVAPEGRSAVRTIAKSDDRLAALHAAVADWDSQPSETSVKRVLDRLAAITELDRQRSRGEQRLALRKAEELASRIEVRNRSLTSVTVATVRVFVDGHNEGLGEPVAVRTVREALLRKGYRLVGARPDADLGMKVVGSAKERTTTIGGTEPIQEAITSVSIEAAWALDGSLYFYGASTGNGASSISREAALEIGYKEAAEKIVTAFDAHVRHSEGSGAGDRQTAVQAR